VGLALPTPFLYAPFLVVFALKQLLLEAFRQVALAPRGLVNSAGFELLMIPSLTWL